MGIKSTLIKPYARRVARQIAEMRTHAVEGQERTMKLLVNRASLTQFGKEHRFPSIVTYRDFKERIPVRDYEALKPWIERIKQGEKDVLWPGRPRYFAKTSGTTSGVKYIPLTKESLPNHFGSARNALFNYAALSGNFRFLDGKMIFLSGSPEMDSINGIPTGRLSGIVNHQVPSWLRTDQLPSYETNCIEDWETKLGRIVSETVQQNMTMISGIPPWVQMYFEWLLEASGRKTIRSLFPNFSVFAYGGVNYEPYRESIEQLVGERIDSVETYPASEGFIAFQDHPKHQGLLLNANSGIFFEFIPVEEYGKPDPVRHWLGEVRTGVNYAVVINSNAGLWGYDIGDTIEFTSVHPYRLRVTGRVKHFISAFGEHVIGKEVEDALHEVSAAHGARIAEFTVAPQVKPAEGLPYHEWLIEFEQSPQDLEAFASALDQAMLCRNIYYQDLIEGRILRPLVIRRLQRDAFRSVMRSEGKLGGQNKIPHLSNDRHIADKLYPYIQER